MKTKLVKLFLCVFALTVLSCKNETSSISIDYKYADKEQTFNCEGANNTLLNEALYSFEDDLLQHFNTNNNLRRAYSMFFRNAMYNRAKYTDIISEHTKTVFEALKEDKTLWTAKTNNGRLNYNSNVVSCIATNIKNKDLNTTFNALLATNSMSSRLFGEPLRLSISQAASDKYLGMYVALDYFYNNLFDIDFSKVNLQKPDTNVDFNRVPPKTHIEAEKDPHAGHNH